MRVITSRLGSLCLVALLFSRQAAASQQTVDDRAEVAARSKAATEKTTADTVPGRSVTASPDAQGPFGLRAGMTLQELKELVPDLKADSKSPTLYSVERLPNGHPKFDLYLMTISPTVGLCKLSAGTAKVEMNDFGTQLKEAFRSVVEPIRQKYGNSKDYDFLRAGSIWKDPNDWAMGLLKEERVLASVWTFHDARPDRVSAILVKALATRRTSGLIQLMYEFDNLHACTAESDRSENSVF